MSLENLATHVRSRGRGRDTELVHMTPSEVKGLQALALAHGGSLTVNPDTGLPEAGFLEAILPTIAGIGLSMIPGVGPLAAAGIVGGGTALATGSIEKGLVAGLGGWGGASIGSGLMGLGAGAASSTLAGQTAAFADLGLAPALSGNAANLAAGAGQFAAAPMAGLSSIGYSPVAAALAPAVFDTGEQNNNNNNTVDDNSYIRPYDYDYKSQTFTPLEPIKASEWGSRQFADGGYVGRDAEINKLYHDIVGRDANAGDLAIWNRGDARGFGMDTIASQMRTAPEAIEYAKRQAAPEAQAVQAAQDQAAQLEARKGDVSQQYGNILGRSADQAGLDYWSQQLAGGMTIPDMRAAMVQSPEFQGQVQRNLQQQQARSGLPTISPQNQIEQNYYNMTGRAPSVEERDWWANQIVQGESPELTRQRMMQAPEVQSFLKSPDASAQQIGGAMMSQRYQRPVQPVSSDVLNYNQILANTARNEYINMPQPQALRPRSPEEMSSFQERIAQGAADLQTKLSEASGPKPDQYAELQKQIADLQAQRNSYNPYGYESTLGYGLGDGTGGGDGPAGEGDSPGDSTDGGVGDANLASGGSIARYMGGGGISNLGSYSDGGRLLKGPGDGVSDNIPATIQGGQPARLADGEFVVPARIVSEIGNGSTDAGARRLYAMMDRIQKAREKTVGKDRVAVDSQASKYLPA